MQTSESETPTRSVPVFSRGGLSLAVGLICISIFIGAGCAHTGVKPSTSVQKRPTASRSRLTGSRQKSFDQLIVHAVFGSQASPINETEGPLKTAGSALGSVLDAIGITGSRIVAVGLTEELLVRCTGDCQLIDAQGGSILPGLQGKQERVIDGRRSHSGLVLKGNDLASTEAHIQSYLVAHPEKTWIVGEGWDRHDFKSGLPQCKDLDRVSTQKPIALFDSTGRSLWVNSLALAQAGVGRETADPDGGKIIRDEMGGSTGILLETASAMVWRFFSSQGDQDLKSAILRSQDEAFSRGITSVQGDTVPVELEAARAYASLEESGSLQLRVLLWGDLSESDQEFLEMAQFAMNRKSSARVRLLGWRGFLEDGFDFFKPEALQRLILRANRAGFPVVLVTNGDQSNQVAMDAFAAARKKLNSLISNRIERVSELGEGKTDWGRIEPGFEADLALFDRGSKTSPVGVWVAGVRVR